MSINDKIKQVLTLKNLSPSYLADDIGVQRSSISHILSGRNRPSLDIIQKIVRRFPEFSYEWFLEDDVQLSTFELPLQPNSPIRPSVPTRSIQPLSSDMPLIAEPNNRSAYSSASQNETIIPKQKDPSSDKSIERILIFYTDGTFKEYSPA